MSLTLLTTLDNSISANLLKSKLENEGIPCFLANENFSNLMPHYYNMLGSGVRVMVPKEQLEKAIEIAQLDHDTLNCPNCGSSNVQNSIEKTKNKIKLGFIALLFTLPIGNLLNDYRCQECKYKFKA